MVDVFPLHDGQEEEGSHPIAFLIHFATGVSLGLLDVPGLTGEIRHGSEPNRVSRCDVTRRQSIG
jgi:hypothetical protein